MTYLYWYLYFCVAFGIVSFLVGVITDLRGIHDDKFGSNLIDIRNKHSYNSKTGWTETSEVGLTFNVVFWWIVFVNTLPIVNIFMIWVWTSVLLHELKLKKQHT